MLSFKKNTNFIAEYLLYFIIYILLIYKNNGHARFSWYVHFKHVRQPFVISSIICMTVSLNKHN